MLKIILISGVLIAPSIDLIFCNLILNGIANYLNVGLPNCYRKIIPQFKTVDSIIKNCFYINSLECSLMVFYMRCKDTIFILNNGIKYYVDTCQDRLILFLTKRNLTLKNSLFYTSKLFNYMTRNFFRFYFFRFNSRKNS